MIYSHSRLSSFEQCPLKFKFKYIDKVKTETEESVEAFLGKRVHEALEKLYKDLKFQKLNTLEELLAWYHEEWKKTWNDQVQIVRKEYTQENYEKMGVKFITDYYEHHKPFDQSRSIGLEQRVVIKLDPDGRYVLQGYIDRLATPKEGVYEIHDYKTNSNLPLMEYLHNDRQLALYAIAIKQSYQDAKDVRLIWHFLAFDKSIEITKSEKDLETLKKETITLINKVEQTKEFPARVSALCNWCEYRPMCPMWKHEYKTSQLPANEYLKEDGVVLVNKYADLVAQKKHRTEELDSEIEKVKEAILSYAEKEKLKVLTGSDHRMTIWSKNVVKFPSKNEPGREEVEHILKEDGKWEDFSTLDGFKLSKMVQDGMLPETIIKKLALFARKEKVERLYLKQKDGKEVN